MSLQNVYWSHGSLSEAGKIADILAIGDSWFWYLFPGGSLINSIGDLVAPKGHNILAVGNNGAEALDFVEGKYKRAANNLLRLYGSSASALLISAGGNDFAGFNDLRPMLKDDCSTAEDAESCFVEGDRYAKGTVRWLIHRAFLSYGRLITNALSVMPPSAKIFVHNYDYSIPTGEGVFGLDGRGWIKPALEDARVPDDLHQDVMCWMVDLHTAVLHELFSLMPDRIVPMDSRGTLAPDDWVNELHPKAKGFEKIAVQAWLPHLKQAGLA